MLCGGLSRVAGLYPAQARSSLLRCDSRKFLQTLSSLYRGQRLPQFLTTVVHRQTDRQTDTQTNRL